MGRSRRLAFWRTSASGCLRCTAAVAVFIGAIAVSRRMNRSRHTRRDDSKRVVAKTPAPVADSTAPPVVASSRSRFPVRCFRGHAARQSRPSRMASLPAVGSRTDVARRSVPATRFDAKLSNGKRPSAVDGTDEPGFPSHCQEMRARRRSKKRSGLRLRRCSCQARERWRLIRTRVTTIRRDRNLRSYLPAVSVLESTLRPVAPVRRSCVDSLSSSVAGTDWTRRS